MSQAVTLEDIKQQQTKINQMISAFESRQNVSDFFPLEISMPELNDGEKWVGLVISADGIKKEHVILLPNDRSDDTWENQMKWAESIGGHLPDRIEQAMLFKCLKDEFEEEAYWSCEQHAREAGWAWCQVFRNGSQYDSTKFSKLRARAVRRELVI